MLKYCNEQWGKNKELLFEALHKDKTLDMCNYKHLVELIVEYILNPDGEDEYDAKNITVIDNGDYQGTLLFLIPRKTYQPREDEYLMSCVSYGSCSGCDALLNLQDDLSHRSEKALSGFMSLCSHIVCNMTKPYNNGWRSDEKYEHVEE